MQTTAPASPPPLTPDVLAKYRLPTNTNTPAPPAGGAPTQPVQPAPAAPQPQGFFSKLFTPFAGKAQFGGAQAQPVAPKTPPPLTPDVLAKYKLPTKFMGGTLKVAPNSVKMPQQSFFSKLLGGGSDLLNEAADNTVKQQTEAGNKMISSVTEGAQKMSDDQTAPDRGNNPTALLHAAEVPLGVASGAVQGVFAPITGIIQAIADKASDSKAVQDFALEYGKGTKDDGTIYGLMHQLESKIDEASQAHPEAAQNLSDSANVLLSVLGGETEAVKGNVGEAGSVTGKAIRDAAIGPPDAGGGGGAVGAVRDAATSAAKNTQTAVRNTADIFGGAAKKVAAAPKAVAKAVGDQSGGALKSAYSQIYGLPPEDIDFLMAHPEYAHPEALSQASLSNLGKDVEGNIAEARKSVPTSQDLAEEVKTAALKKTGGVLASVPKPEDVGKEVNDALQARAQAIHEHAATYPTGPDKKPIDVDPNWLRDQINKIPGIEIDAKTGRVGFEDPNAPVSTGKTGTKLNPLESPHAAQRLQDLLDSWQKYFKTGKLSRPDFVDFRQGVAKALANFKGGVDLPLEKIGAQLYAKFNEQYRPQIRGLASKDAKYAQMTNDLDRLKKGLAVEDDFGNLQPQDTALSTILNATKDTKGEVAKRLEELVPGITKKLQGMEQANAEVSRLTHGLIDEKGNLIETAANKIAGAGKTGKDVLTNRLEELVPGISKKIAQMQEFNKKWSDLVDEEGKQRPGALLNIKNSLNYGRDANLERLESLMPGISDRLRLIKASENFHGTLGLKPGKYASGAAVSQILTGNPFIGIVAMAATNPTVGLRILRALSKTKK